MKPELFMSIGASKVADDMYILPRKYDGTVYGETCAIIGFGKKIVSSILKIEEPTFKKIKACVELKEVPGIETLSPHRLEALSSMIHFLDEVEDDEIILFNIEPKGEGTRYEKQYPTANICLPGGCMEYQDDFDWRRTALREFAEEVGINLSSADMEFVTKQRYNFPDKLAFYFWYRIKQINRS